ncbi:MAG: MBL fold metallo-hydrolase, partial [Eubacteriales bacterium]|nr:MBL fold metallo-hydrolase [Eubacteriales bacterium]
MIERIFLPVGQGAFYLEKFEILGKTINVIYDCGSIDKYPYVKNSAILEREIKKNFKKNEEIHAVFISHLHEDHINGIEYLLDHCKVKKIFFPLLTDNKPIALLNYLINGTHNKYNTESNERDFIYDFINDPKDALSKWEYDKSIEVYGISPYKSENSDEDSDTNSNTVQEIPSGTNVADKVFSEEVFWEYIPYNFEYKDRNEELRELLNNDAKLKELLYKDDKINKDIVEYLIDSIDKNNWKDIEKRLKEILKDNKKINLYSNTNSMTLYSGLNYKCKPFLIHDFLCSSYLSDAYGFLYSSSIPTGCLYTGDYEGGIRKLEKTYFNTYGEYIGILQIPHHGSKRNYRKTLLKKLKNCKFCIISFGENNNYHHPSGYVVDDIIKNRRIPLLVTEDITTKVCFK